SRASPIRAPTSRRGGSENNSAQTMPQITTTHNGQEITVDVPDETVIEWGFLPKAEIQKSYVPKTNAAAQLQSALESQAQTLREKLAEDPDHVRTILAAQGLPLDESGKVKLPEGGITAEELQQRLQESRSAWEQQYQLKHLRPLETRLTEAEK